MPDERLTKNQRREQARELAKKEREKAQRRDRLMKILVPVIVVVVLLAAGGITWAVIATQPQAAPPVANGPKNMISDGIVFTGQGGTLTATKTAGLKKGQDPVPAETPTSGPVHITTYVDLSCPVCKSFEETNSAQIQAMVKAGKAVLEVKPVAILNNSYQGSQYSQRVNTALACVANYDPDSVPAVMKQLYADQPDEQTTSGFTNNQIVSELKKAGVDNGKITSCVLGQSFSKWVTAATSRATSDASLVAPGAQGFGTPTIVINGKLLSGTAFSQSLTSASAFKAVLDSAAGA